MAVPKKIRRGLVAFVTFVGGLYFFAEFVTPKSQLPETVFGVPFDTFHTTLSDAVALIGTMAIGLGIINLLRVHGGTIVRGRKGMLNSVALLFGLFTVFAIEIKDFSYSDKRTTAQQRVDQLVPYVDAIVNDFDQEGLDPGPRFAALRETLEQTKKRAQLQGHFFFAADESKEREELFAVITKSEEQTAELEEALTKKAPAKHLVQALDTTLMKLSAALRTISEANYNKTNAKRASEFVFNAFFVPLGSAMFSLLAFYVASAAYRTFRIRSLEALVMMCTALVVMLGQIPMGYIYISHDLPSIRNWLLANISTPSFRAIFFGSSVAGLAMAMRMWFSLEQSPLGADDTDNSSAGGN